MMKKINNAVVLFLFFLSCSDSDESNHHVDCRIHQGLCVQSTEQGEITLDINPKPVRSMKPLQVTVTIEPQKNPEFIVVDLSMPGMVMGFNQVVLSRVDRGTFQGQGVIPACPSGKRVWKAKILIGKEVQAEFLFHVR